MDIRIIVFQLMRFEELMQNTFSLALTLACSPAQSSRTATTRLTCGDKVQPIWLNGLRLRSENLDLVSIGKAMTNGNKSMVDFTANTMATDHGVNGKSKVEHRGPLWQSQNITFGREDVEL